MNKWLLGIFMGFPAVAALILSSGKGLRAGFHRPKQYIEIDDKPVLYHTAKKFAPLVNPLIILADPDWWPYIQSQLADQDLVYHLLEGDTSRQRTIQLGIRYLSRLETPPEIVLIHDAVRPLISQASILQIIAATKQYQAAGCTRPTINTIIENSDTYRGSVTRSKYIESHTPQGFTLASLITAYQYISPEDLENATECLEIVHKYAGISAKLIPVDFRSMKITYMEDLFTVTNFMHLERRRKVLLTGGNKGIGLALTQKLSELGFHLYICGRDSKSLSQVSQTFNVRSFSCDVRQEEQVRNMFSQLPEIDILINNAGILVNKPLLNTSLQEWNNVLQTNLTGPFLCCREFIRGVDPSKGGLIVNIGSSSVNGGRCNQSAYSCSKAALQTLSESCNLEGKEKNIVSLCFHPRRTKTQMRATNFSSEDSENCLHPSQVADSIVYFIVQNLSHISGNKIHIT